nr:amidohydrolase family protein [Sphingomonas sp. Y57]
MSAVVFDNARVFDGWNQECQEGMSVLVQDDRIVEIADRPVKYENARRVNVNGRTLMPGLIDMHVHCYLADMNAERIDYIGHAYRAAHAVRLLEHALDCGFTTVRDIGGGDWSLAQALNEGLIRGPRFFYAGRIISMTGGHGDGRPMKYDAHMHEQGYCSCGQFNVLAAISDGPTECLRAARETLRRGAHTVKIMASGGIASPTDPLGVNQFQDDEIRAIVAECVMRGSYASAHCHPAKATRRSVELGVRCIEHGTLVDAETAAFVASRDAFIVPTMAVLSAMHELGGDLGLPPQSQAKLKEVFGLAQGGLDNMRNAGVKLGFGTDLMGKTYDRQCTEFMLRSEVFTPLEILRQATSIGAEILQHSGRLGCVAVGAYADLIVVDGDPLSDISLLAEDGRKLSVIMRAGEMVKNRL